MRLIDADRIVYSWQIDADGQEHDGVTLQSIINKIPTIKPEPHWIPCSERLPEAPTFCLVTTDGIYNDVIDIALYTSVGWHKASKVVAWMPLPEPYREEGEA